MTILHISDLHFVKNAGTYNMERILLREAEEAVRGKGEGEKLLIVTGDFHNFKEEDYAQAGKFLHDLKDAMGLDMAKDVFVIPGNHDVGNDMTLDKALSGVDEFWKDNLDNNVARLKEGKRSPSIVNQRLRAFRPYSEFVRALGIYDEEPAAGTDPDYPARVHVRCWRGKLNLLHLNTALAADGSPDKGNQVFDVDTAAKPETWEKLNTKDIPALALGHNSFFDLAKGDKEHPSMELQKNLKPVFFDYHVSAYLCGDTHLRELDGDQQHIHLGEGYCATLSIPNVVCAKSIADMTDSYSDFGYYLHEWDESTDQVYLQFQRWNPRFITSTRPEGRADEGYKMRRETAPTKEDEQSAALSDPSAPAAALRAYLADTLRRTRDEHPSFRLISVDEIDQKLFPGIRETAFAHIPAQGSVGQGGPVSPVWDIVRESWKTKPVPNVVIEGEGGIGKTTALFSLCNAREPDVPAVYVPMHQLLRKDGTLIDISDYLNALDKNGYGPQICRLASTPMGERPNLLVLLDGFNEVRQDRRWDMLDAVNAWYTTHPGAQLVAVSRPMDGLNLGKALAGNPLAVTLAPLEREVIRRYLKGYYREIPTDSAPVWKNLRYPLFLTLYLKTGALEGKSSAGYPLAPKRADSGGALIWNFLQRELLRQTDEGWVLRCALACEYLLPRIAWEMTERHSFVLDQDEAIQWTEQALAELDAKALPKHLAALFRTYERKHAKKRGTLPDFSGVDWPRTVLHDCGLLVPYQEEERDEAGADGPGRYALMHQNFRDCLAALHLLNAAEAAKRGLPRLWRRSHDPYVLDYAAELADADTAARLWEALRTLRPTDSAAVYTQLELQKRRGDGRALDFSGMDLRGLSLAPYLRRGEGKLVLFRSAALSAGTALERGTFQFQGHSGSVNCVAALQDRRCVSGSHDGSLRVWDIDSGACLRTLKGHKSLVSCVAALSGGRCISGSFDNTLRVWDIESGAYLKILKGHSNLVECMAVLSNGRCVSGSYDGTLRVWDADSGVCLKTLEGHPYRMVSCIAALPDGQIVSGYYDGMVRIWDCDTGDCCHILKGHSDWVRSVAVLPDGRIVSGSDDKSILVWDIESGNIQCTLEGHNDWVTSVAALLDGRCISGSFDKTLRIWDVDRGICQRTLEKHSDCVLCITVLPDGRCVSGSGDNTLRVWDVNSGECLTILKRHDSAVKCVATLFDGRCVSGSDDNTLRVWDIDGEECPRKLEGHTTWVSCVAALPDRRHVISGSGDKTLKIWDIDRGVCLRTMEAHSDRVKCVTALPDGRCVSGAYDNTLRVWDIDSGVSVRTLAGHSNWVFCVAALPDGGHVVSGSCDNTLRVWDVDTGVCLRELKGHTNWVLCVVALPDGRIVSGSNDGTLRVWGADSGESLRVLEGHNGSVECVAALPDGRIVSGSIDGTLRIWDPDTGECLDILTSMDIYVYGMDFSRAILTPDLAKQLWQNGAKISDADYQNYVLPKP